MKTTQDKRLKLRHIKHKIGMYRVNPVAEF